MRLRERERALEGAAVNSPSGEPVSPSLRLFPPPLSPSQASSSEERCRPLTTAAGLSSPSTSSGGEDTRRRDVEREAGRAEEEIYTAVELLGVASPLL
ncbi:uncharacterized protein DS421_15g510480 [Arachis hypogaea]|nr:uncharacterized protein DS421_15g510480 [Arachis hypogaea]